MKGGEYQVSKIQKIVKYGTALATVAAISPVSGVLAQVTADPVTINAPAGTEFTKLQNLQPSAFIAGAIAFLLGIAGVVAFLFLLWGGLQWILAGGDKEGTEKARKKITSALIGLAIVFSAYALIFIIRALFNINVIGVSLNSLGGI